MKNQKVNIEKRRYHWEILAILLGLFLIKFGIDDENNNRISIGHNSKGLMFVHTGLMTCFYGVALIFSSCASIYGKKKNK